MNAENITVSGIPEIQSGINSSRRLSPRVIYDVEKCLENISIGDTEKERMEEYALFLTGIIEAGKGFDFDIYPDKISPSHSCSDNRGNIIYTLKDLFGGRVRSSTKCNSLEWKIESETAVKMAEIVAPNSPLATEAIIAYKKWELTDNYAERLKIAQDYKDKKRKGFQLKADDYLELVDNPMFLAGVFTRKGALYCRKNRGGIPDKQNRFIGLSLKNKALREAIYLKYFISFNSGTISNFIRLGKGESAKILWNIRNFMINDIAEYEIREYKDKQEAIQTEELLKQVLAGR